MLNENFSFDRTEGGGGGARGYWTLNDAEKASQEQEKRILASMTTLSLDGKKYCISLNWEYF